MVYTCILILIPPICIINMYISHIKTFMARSSRKVEDFCEFCAIANKRDETAKILFENENIVIFSDIVPASKFHFLAVPKKHIANVMCLTKEDKVLGLWSF